MAVDFDFDGTFDEDTDDEGLPGEDFDDEEGEEPPRRRNPFRLILLVLVILVLLCVVCFLGSRFVPLPDNLAGLIPGVGEPTPAPAPATDTPAPEPTGEAPSPEPGEPADSEPTAEATVPAEPTGEAPVPAEPTEEPTEDPTVVVEPTEEPTVVVEPTEEPTDVVEPTEEPTLVVEPTDDTVSEHDEEPVEPTATTVPVPGPTATPGPTVVVTVTTCDNNTLPIADANGPYNAMMGKGQAVVTFDGSNSSDSDGAIVSYEWDFGDGSAVGSGESVAHGYTSTGSFVATLTVTDDCGDSAQATAEVTIGGPTPPAGTGTPVATPSPVPPPPPPSGTLGFCYRVQYGDTLSGIAWRFGVTWRDLAYVNKVSMGYFVIAGQGLFIPVGQITDGPNVYEVQSGDTLNSVAYHCGLTAATVARANGLNLNESLSPGQMLLIPPWRYR